MEDVGLASPNRQSRDPHVVTPDSQLPDLTAPDSSSKGDDRVKWLFMLNLYSKQNLNSQEALCDGVIARIDGSTDGTVYDETRKPSRLHLVHLAAMSLELVSSL